jgi:hypothetical protein
MNNIQQLLKEVIITNDKIACMEKLAEIDLQFLHYKRTNNRQTLRYKLEINKFYDIIEKFNTLHNANFKPVTRNNNFIRRITKKIKSTKQKREKPTQQKTQISEQEIQLGDAKEFNSHDKHTHNNNYSHNAIPCKCCGPANDRYDNERIPIIVNISNAEPLQKSKCFWC